MASMSAFQLRQNSKILSSSEASMVPPQVVTIVCLYIAHVAIIFKLAKI